MSTSKVTAVFFLLILLMGTVSDAFAAKRLGGGGNVGQHRSTESLQRAPAPQPSPPSAVPGYAQPPAPMQAPPLQQRSSWWGPVAGFAGGALLGSLFFGHGGFGGGGAFLGILMWGMFGVLFVFLIRRFLQSAAPVAPRVETQMQTMAPTPLGNAPLRPPLQLPQGFDLEAFLHQAKVTYVRLQAANDAGDLHDLRACTTPEMYAEISLEIQGRRGVPQRVEVLQLDAELLDLSPQGDVALATVQYFVTAREDGGVPQSYTELWHVRKILSEPNSPWLLAGIEQVS